MLKNTAAAFADTKPHYDILDGLRGVAAVMVVCFHLFEAYATSHLDQQINHGYLAVDFFYILSGFVIGYAYDDRWERGLTVAGFVKRRLVRLHPMVMMGAVIGAVMFYTQGCAVWDVSKVPLALLLLSTLANLFLVPVSTEFEVRGVGEMYPLNGPSWSLFFEYIGNVLYALFVRRLPTMVLAALVALAGVGLTAFAVAGPYGDLCVGFSMTPDNLLGGSLRLLFAFSAGLLLSRVFRPVRVRGAFWLCGLLVVALLAVPRLGGADGLWMNGLYDAVCVVAVFPVLVWLGASGQTTDRHSARVCKFLGDISYPLYMVHYPFIYLYYAWVKNEGLTFVQSLPEAAALVVGSIALAWVCLRFYDMPVRRWLAARFLNRRAVG